MSIKTRKGFALIVAMLAVIALGAVTSVAAFGSGETSRSGEAQAGADVEEGVRAVPSPNNKKSDDVGVCAYSEAENKHHFKKVPKPKKEGKAGKDSSLIKEIEKGGQVADSPAYCEELNAILADPPKGHEAVEEREAASEDGPVVEAPSAAVEGEKVFETSEGNQGGSQAAGQ